MTRRRATSSAIATASTVASSADRWGAGRKSAKLAPRAGFEPATHGLTVRGGGWPTPRDDNRMRHLRRQPQHILSSDARASFTTIAEKVRVKPDVRRT